MNSKNYFLLKAVGMILFLSSISSFTCTKQCVQFSSAYMGTWQTTTADLKVRTKTGFMKYKFTPVQIPVTLTILDGGRATCTLGDVKLDHLTLTANKGDSTKTGIAYIIDCGEVSKLNPNDPLTKNKIELWVKPIGTGNKLQVEVRQMEVLDAFPMGELLLSKQ